VGYLCILEKGGDFFFTTGFSPSQKKITSSGHFYNEKTFVPHYGTL